jgi:phage tail sheath gpL-like
MINAIFTNNDGNDATIKAPGENLRYDFDYSAWLTELTDTISGTPTVTGTGLTITGVSTASGVVSAFIAGGTLGQTYEATCSATTAAGRIKQKKLVLYIR